MITCAATAFIRTRSGKAVEAGEPFVPEVLYKDTYYPICGHDFWNNHNGATTVCKFFGFEKGETKVTMAVYDVDAMPVGGCNPGEELTQCTGGGNEWGNFTYSRHANGLWCQQGQKIGLTVTCTASAYVYMRLYILNLYELRGAYACVMRNHHSDAHLRNRHSDAHMCNRHSDAHMRNRHSHAHMRNRHSNAHMRNHHSHAHSRCM